jgi:hypothetical protein
LVEVEIIRLGGSIPSLATRYNVVSEFKLLIMKKLRKDTRYSASIIKEMLAFELEDSTNLDAETIKLILYRNAKLESVMRKNFKKGRPHSMKKLVEVVKKTLEFRKEIGLI